MGKGEVRGLKARGNFTIGEKWANGIAEAFTVRYDGNKDSAVFTGSYKNITSAKIYEDGKEVQVTKDTDKDRISFEADVGKTYTIDISETNINELKIRRLHFKSASP